ncbi:efflux RND transporter permease subunit [Metabacillus halosaccharovorans]|uniref:Efflux RND transporter permease subunit n=1 Tax=Metabacillus halosaccharovorans TaxID=930124 RepID=A0ABT3DHE7_9BACI|nr:efflux RND transporter permease subunit [Metabacillus halosaccharovorans]MCV9886475.1 efflux RND transporter permease subunit [Metabacillus halosaccharovorans]
MKISHFSINRPVFTIVTMLLVVILGTVSVINIPLKLIPEINPPIGVVVTNYEGADPNEVVEKVSKPLEEVLSTVQGIDTITSTSQESASLVIMKFTWTTHIDDIQDEIRTRMEDAPLPDDAGEPRFLKFDPSQFPIIQLSLSSSQDTKQLQNLAGELEQELSKTAGVASVNLSGLQTDEVSVKLDQHKLEQYSLSQSDIVDTIRANSVTTPGDPVVSDGKQLTTRVISSIDSIDVLKSLIVKKDPATGDNITVGDIADVEMAIEESNTTTRANQNPSLLVSILQQSDANTASVSDAFQEKLTNILSEEKYESINADIIFDQGEYVDQAIGNMFNTLIIGGILAMLILFVFLKSMKSPLIIGVAIPYSVIVTFVLMYFANFTLNIMTLGGLALGIGMLVDNAIVVIENIYRHLSMGKNPKDAAYQGAKEIGPAIIASTLTTVAVFIPVVFITGIIGDLFTEFALTIAFSLFASLFVALTIVPMLASQLLKKPAKNIEKVRRESTFMHSLDNAIKWSLRNRTVVLSITLVVFAGSVYGLTRVGTVFLPNTDEGFFTIDVELENGSSLSETSKVVTAIEEELEEEDGVDLYVSLIGTTQEESFRGTGRTNIAEIYVKLKNLEFRNVTTFDLIDNVQKTLENVARGENKTAKLSFHTQSSTGSTPNTLTFHVKDTNETRLKESVAQIDNALVKLADVDELSNDLTQTVEEIQITINRDKALDNGLSPVQIGMVVNDVTRGTDAIQMTNEHDHEIYMVNVRYDETVSEDVDALKGLLIKKPDNSFVELGDISTIQVGEGPVSIQRIDKQPAVQYTVRYSNSTNLGDFSNLVDKEIKELDLPEETDISFSGDRELLESSMDDMLLAFILAVIFIYIVMAAQFESFKYPFVIMFTVPLMLIGVAVALTVTKSPISLTVVIGLIVLAGIVVNNAIVIVDFINQKKAQGFKTYDALVVSVRVRLRPILMTALTTILGLVPLALGLGEGTEINRPMGITVIGGLISSTFLSLFIIPIVYSLVDRETRRMNKKYVTPDGHLVSAYRIEDPIFHQNGKRDSKKEELHEPSKFDKDDMVNMLEQMIDIVKDKKK